MRTTYSNKAKYIFLVRISKCCGFGFLYFIIIVDNTHAGTTLQIQYGKSVCATVWYLFELNNPSGLIDMFPDVVRSGSFVSSSSRTFRTKIGAVFICKGRSQCSPHAFPADDDDVISIIVICISTNAVCGSWRVVWALSASHVPPSGPWLWLNMNNVCRRKFITQTRNYTCA